MFSGFSNSKLKTGNKGGGGGDGDSEVKSACFW